jgi:hypothetical protein
MIWLLPHAHPLLPLPQKFVSLSQSSCVSPVELHYFIWRKGEGEAGGEQNHAEKAWSSINHAILSGVEMEGGGGGCGTSYTLTAHLTVIPPPPHTSLWKATLCFSTARKPPPPPQPKGGGRGRAPNDCLRRRRSAEEGRWRERRDRAIYF